MTLMSSELLAPWLRSLPVADQILISGATLILADVKMRHPGRFDFDERRLRDSRSPREARRYALALVADHNNESDEDGRRVASLCQAVATKIADRFPYRA